MNYEPIAEITANELVIQVTKSENDVATKFPYRTSQRVEREENYEIVINLDDWTGVTTEQERFLEEHADVLQYDIYSTVEMEDNNAE